MALADLCRLSRPHFGQAVTWLLLYCGFQVVLPRTFAVAAGDPTGPATVLAWLPEAAVTSPLPFAACKGLFLAAAALCACQLLLPWSAWGAAAACTAFMALHFERADKLSHSTHLTSQLLWVQALWYHFYRREVRDALRAGTFWATPLYPRWAFLLGLFAVGVFHTYAGVTKLAVSGMEWMNGTSLQLWVHLWGRTDSPIRAFVVEHRTAVVVLQWVTVVVEGAAVLAVFVRWLRLPLGLGLLGFYAGVVGMFGYPFAFNAALTGVFLLPLAEWAAVVRRRVPMPPHVAGRLAAAVMLVLLVLRLGAGNQPFLFVPAAWAFVLLVCLADGGDGTRIGTRDEEDRR